MDMKTIRKELIRWITLVEYYQFENSQLKNQLADALGGSLSDASLRLAEYHQTELLRIDEMMHQLKAALRQQERALPAMDSADRCSPPLLEDAHARATLTDQAGTAEKLERCRRHVRLVGDEFKEVKKAFGDYLATIANR